jgi:hypothetical protein
MKTVKAWAGRCYVCGESIGDQFMLASMSPSDRVFLVHETCSELIEAGILTVRVEIHELKPKKRGKK